jgi:translation initiation factor RLI1
LIADGELREVLKSGLTAYWKFQRNVKVELVDLRLQTMEVGGQEIPETVLILLGPPGMGKTRLVRAILAAMSRRKEDSAMAMYTADKAALESDEIFVDFITGQHDAFVIEDADHSNAPAFPARGRGGPAPPASRQPGRRP